MKQSKRTGPGWSVPYCLPLAVAAVAGGVLFAGFPAKKGLQASIFAVTSDADGDGLVDAQEKVLGTSALSVDTDVDGWRDVEEFARQTSPLFAQSQPGGDEIQVGMSAYGSEGGLHVLVGMFVPDTNLREKKIALGVMIRGRMYPLPSDDWMHDADLSILHGQAPTSRIALIDIPVDPLLVHANRDITFFVTVAVSGSGRVGAAASVRLRSIQGMVALVTPDPSVLTMTMPLSSGGQGSSSSIYVPLPLDDSEDWPAGWTPGQICFQTTSTVGTAGAQITQQVNSSSCQSGFDAACPSSCSSSVGSTFTTVDPVVLIGG